MDKMPAELPLADTAMPYRVLLMGPSLEQKGGMASVQKLIVQQVWDDRAEFGAAGSGASSEAERAAMALSLQHVSTHDEGSLLHRLNVFAIALSHLLYKLIQNDIDLVHLHVSEKGSVLRKILLLWLIKAFRKPVLMHTHGCEFHTFHESLPKWLQQGVNASLQRADGFIVLSQSWQDYYLTHCDLDPSRVIVLPNPVEIPADIPHRDDSPRIQFVFLGRVGQRKGAFDLIKAWAQLPTECLNKSQMILAGDGELDYAQNLIEKLNLAASVKLAGWINGLQRNQLLQASNVFILPSYNEGLPMAMLEAMAWGLPVISTPVGGIPEMVDPQKTGYLVNPGDIQGLTKAMRTLIEDASLRAAMGHSARERVKPLDVKVYHDKLRAIYKRYL
ncbi:MAG: glycosyltransferase family 4 protein [Phormidesmis sp. RL_2_1]|nr:glycosyltransferase family 4 protein [Phormidesmis sp. RL_2_1]